MWLECLHSNEALGGCVRVSPGYRVAKTHRMPHLYLLFSVKEPYNLWLFSG